MRDRQSNLSKFILGSALMLGVVNASAASAFVSFSVGSQSSDQGLLSTTLGDTQEVVSLGSGESYAIGWGIANESARFLLEYNYSSIDAGTLESLDKSSLFYSGYWTPKLLYGFSAIAGAGVGLTYIELSESASFGSPTIKDNGLEYKFSIGLEYQLNRKVELYGLIEKIYSNNYSEDYTSSADTRGTVTFNDDDQSRLTLGVNLYY